MAVYKEEKTNTWRVIYRYTDWNGERKQSQKRGFKTKREAQSWEREQLNKLGGDLDMNFKSFVEHYSEDMQTRLKENTWETKKHIIDKKLVPYFGKLKMCNITAQQIITWQNELIDYRDDKGKPYSPVYLKTIHNQLSAIFNHAVRYYNLKENPCQKAGSMGKKKNREMLFWTKDEYLKFADVMMDKPLSYYAFEMLYWTGGEAPRRLRSPAAPITSAEPTPHESLFHIEKNLRNEFTFVAGGEVIVDTELVGIRKNLQLVLPAEVQQLPIGALHGLVGAVVVNARHLACRQNFDVLRFLCFLDGQECHGGLGVSSVQNIFVRDNDTGLEEDWELILQCLRKTLLRGDADFPEGLRSVHRGEEDTALGDVLYGHLLIALAEFFYVLHLFAAMRQPVLNQLQAFNLPIDDGKLLPQDDQGAVYGVIFHVLLNFAQGKTQLFHD